MFGIKKKKLVLNNLDATQVKPFRERFSIPDSVTDQEIIIKLLNFIMKDYFHPDAWSESQIKKVLGY